MYALKKGTVLEIEVSDPWEFGKVHGTGPFSAVFLRTFSSKAYTVAELGIAQLLEPLEFDGMVYEYLLLQPRHLESSLEQMEKEHEVPCNLSRISDKSASSPDPLLVSRQEPESTSLVGTVRTQGD